MVPDFCSCLGSYLSPVLETTAILTGSQYSSETSWVAVKELRLIHYSKQILFSTLYPYYGNLNLNPNNFHAEEEL